VLVNKRQDIEHNRNEQNVGFSLRYSTIVLPFSSIY